MSLDPTGDKSTLVQVMVSYQQANSWAIVDQDLCRHMAWLCHYTLNQMVFGDNVFVTQCNTKMLAFKKSFDDQ